MKISIIRRITKYSNHSIIPIFVSILITAGCESINYRKAIDENIMAGKDELALRILIDHLDSDQSYCMLKARLSHLLRKWESAIDLYNKVLNLKIGDINQSQKDKIRYWLAEALWQCGRISESIDTYKLILSNGSTNSIQGYSAKDILIAIGNSNRSGKVNSFKINQFRYLSEYYCVPNAISAIINYWGTRIDPVEVATLLKIDEDIRNLQFKKILLNLSNACEVIGKYDIAVATGGSWIFRLIDDKIPIMINYRVFSNKYIGHASVVYGYDENRKVLLLSDSNIISGRELLSYDRIKDYLFVVLAPKEKDVLKHIDNYFIDKAKMTIDAWDDLIEIMIKEEDGFDDTERVKRLMEESESLFNRLINIRDDISLMDLVGMALLASKLINTNKSNNKIEDIQGKITQTPNPKPQTPIPLVSILATKCNKIESNI